MGRRAEAFVQASEHHDYYWLHTPNGKKAEADWGVQPSRWRPLATMVNAVHPFANNPKTILIGSNHLIMG